MGRTFVELRNANCTGRRHLENAQENMRTKQREQQPRFFPHFASILSMLDAIEIFGVKRQNILSKRNTRIDQMKMLAFALECQEFAYIR